LEDHEKDTLIQECKEKIISLVMEWAKIQKEIDALPKPIVTECDIEKRQNIGEKLLVVKRHLEDEVEKLDRAEKAPNLIDRWDNERS